MRLLQKEFLYYKSNWDEWIVKQLDTNYGLTGCLAGDEGFLITGNFSEFVITKDCKNFYKYTNQGGITDGGIVKFADITNKNHGYPTAIISNGVNDKSLYQIDFDFNNFDTFKERADGVGLSFLRVVNIQTSSSYTTQDIDFDGANYRVIADTDSGLHYAEIPYDSTRDKSNWQTATVSNSRLHKGFVEIGSNALAVPNIGARSITNNDLGVYYIGRYNSSYKPEFLFSESFIFKPNRAKYINSSIGTLLVGENGIIAQKKTGSATTINQIGYYNWQDLAFGNNKILIVSLDGYVTETTDGINFTTPVYTGIDGDVRSIGYCNGRFLIASTLKQIAYKTV